MNSGTSNTDANGRRRAGRVVTQATQNVGTSKPAAIVRSHPWRHVWSSCEQTMSKCDSSVERDIPFILVAQFGDLQEGIDAEALETVDLQATSPVL
jgi:chorismate mutase